MGNERIDDYTAKLQVLIGVPDLWEMDPEIAKTFYNSAVHGLQQRVYDTILREEDQSLLLLDTIIAVESLASTPLNTEEDLPKIKQQVDKLLQIKETYDRTRGYSDPVWKE